MIRLGLRPFWWEWNYFGCQSILAFRRIFRYETSCSCICKSNEGTVYISKELRATLRKYQEPHKPITTAIRKVLDIVEGNKVLVVVVQGRKIRCNKMKRIHEHNKVFCMMLGTIVSLDYCREKCPAAPIVREMFEKSKSEDATEVASLEKFLQPKIEHLRNPPKIEKDLKGSCWVFGVFLSF